MRYMLILVFQRSLINVLSDKDIYAYVTRFLVSRRAKVLVFRVLRRLWRAQIVLSVQAWIGKKKLLFVIFIFYCSM